MFGWFKKKPRPDGPDFSEANSLAKAQKLAADGVLARLFLMPPEFGGQDIPPNIVYVPAWVVPIKARIDQDTILPLLVDGKVTRYSATPEYQGRSFIPIAIAITAFDPEEFGATINIWGEALGRGE